MGAGGGSCSSTSITGKGPGKAVQKKDAKQAGPKNAAGKKPAAQPAKETTKKADASSSRPAAIKGTGAQKAVPKNAGSTKASKTVASAKSKASTPAAKIGKKSAAGCSASG
ncbi:unnamed protein product, partial [Amoebophrya sp. A25]|eukprot:GSA25T00025141001.1